MRKFWNFQRSPVEVRSSLALTDITQQINTNNDQREGSIVRNLARETKSDSDILRTRSNPETVAQARIFTARKSRMALALGVGLVAVVTAGGMAMAGGRGNEINLDSTITPRPVLLTGDIDGDLLGRTIDDVDYTSNLEAVSGSYDGDLLPLSPPFMKERESVPVPISSDVGAYTTQDFDQISEEQVDFFEHQAGHTYIPLRLDVWEKGNNTSVDLEYRMLEAKEGSHLSANIKKFQILKENVSQFYPKLKNCTIRTDFGITGVRQPTLEFRVARVLKPSKLSNETLHEIMYKDKDDIQEQVSSFDGTGVEPQYGHLGFISPGTVTKGQHWSIIVSRADMISGYYPFAQLTSKSYRILEDLIPFTKPDHPYKMCLSFLDL